MAKNSPKFFPPKIFPPELLAPKFLVLNALVILTKIYENMKSLDIGPVFQGSGVKNGP